LPIGYAATNSQPRTVRAMLELLDARAGHRVLDVGCGSGWTSALLAELVGPTGVVLGVELVPALADVARQNVAAAGRPWITVRTADPDALGARGDAPFDRILVSAGSRRMPTPLVRQLAAGGRMVAPVRGRLAVVDSHTDGTTDVRRLGRYSFVPLQWTT